MKDRLHSSALGLSGGQQQRLCIARTIAVRPEVILLDEPTSALDPISTAKIEELIDELKRDFTIAIVTHNMQQAARCADQVAFFYLGELVEVAPAAQLFTAPKRPRERRNTSPAGSAEPVDAPAVQRIQEHTVRSYAEELNRLRDTIAQMGGIAEQQVADAARALVQRDTDRRGGGGGARRGVDALEREVEGFVHPAAGAAPADGPAICGRSSPR